MFELPHYIKFSRECQEEKREGTKNDIEKPALSLLPSSMLLEVGEVLTFGAEKYTAHNWRNGIHLSRLTSAALRHILAFNEGEDMDEESGLSHLAHAICNLAFALEQIKNPVKYDAYDDRYINT
jgi:hypothetical protein